MITYRRRHKYHCCPYSKSKLRSRLAEKPKMQALNDKSLKEFADKGFNSDRFCRYELDGENQKTNSDKSIKAEKSVGGEKLWYNTPDLKKEIHEDLEVLFHEENSTKKFPSCIIQFTKTKPVIKFSENSATATPHLQKRQQMFEMKPKKLIVDSKHSDFKKKNNKKLNNSDRHTLKNKSKISDTYETEDWEGSKCKKSKKEKTSEHFFDPHRNKLNINYQNSTRGIFHHLGEKYSPPNINELEEILKLDKSESLQLSDINLDFSSSEQTKSEISCVPDNLDKCNGQSNKLFEISDKNINNAVEIIPNLDKSKFLKVDRPKIAIRLQRKMKPKVVYISPKIDVEVNNEVLDCSYSCKDSEESNFNQSTVTSENLRNEVESNQIDSSLMEDDTLNKYTKNQPYANKVFSNNVKVKDHQLQLHTSDMTKSNSSSKIKEQEYSTEVGDNVVKEKLTFFSNLNDLSNCGQHFNLNANTTELKIDSSSFKIISPVEKDLDTVCSQNCVIAEDDSKINDKLITKWISDWNEYFTEIDKSTNYSVDKINNLKLKTKSCGDEQPNNKMNGVQSFAHEEELIDKTSNYTNNTPQHTSFMTNDVIEDQNPTSEIISGNNLTVYNDCSESKSKDYCDNNFLSYEEYSLIPLYSEIKSIKTNELSLVDYSEYDLNYKYYDGNYEMWKSIDSPQQLTSILALSDTLPSSLHVGNAWESSNSKFVLNEQIAFSKYEADFPSDEIEFSIDQATNNDITIIQNVQDELVNDEKSDSTNCDELVQLFQHFQHHNQNPVKYSTSNPGLFNISDIKLSALKKLPREKLSDSNENIDKSIPIPLQERMYLCIANDDNIHLYLTSDNYIAYCAIEDKCMVHIAVNTTNCDGIEDKVRHCFNINENGTTMEYWLDASILPFHVPSCDSQLGVFSVNEVDSLESDSGQGNVTTNDNNEDDKDDSNVDMIAGEWEMIDSDDESNADSWLNNPSVIDMYEENNIDFSQIFPDFNQEKSIFSDPDSDLSDVSDSNVESYSNKKLNITTNQLHYLSKDINKSSNIIDERMTSNYLEHGENTKKNLDLHVRNENSLTLPDQLFSDIGCETKSSLLEDSKYVTSDDTRIKNHDSFLLESKQKDYHKKESEILAKGEVTLKNILLMDTILNQQLLVQKLNICAKEKIQRKLPATVMFHYNDNMETITHSLLGQFQPPTISILSKRPFGTKSKIFKHVTFADGVLPGEGLEASTHNNDRLLSPPPLKTLIQKCLKFKRRRSKVRPRLTMFSNKATMPSDIQCHLGDLPIKETIAFESADSPSGNNDHQTSENMSTPPRSTRELTPVPSDDDCWDDVDNI